MEEKVTYTYKVYPLTKFKPKENNDHTFIMVPSQAFPLLKGEFVAQSLYTYMVDKFNKEQSFAWPSLQRIMNDIGGSKNTILKAIRLLEEKKLLQVFRSKSSPEKNNVNKYVVYFPVFNPLTDEEESMIYDGEIFEATI